MGIDASSIVALVGIISTGLLGYVGYRRSKKADTAAEKASAIEQVIGGLNTLVDNLQEDNGILRIQNRELVDMIKGLKGALQQVTDERNEIREERNELAKELRALKRQYGTAN